MFRSLVLSTVLGLFSLAAQSQNTQVPFHKNLSLLCSPEVSFDVLKSGNFSNIVSLKSKLPKRFIQIEDGSIIVSTLTFDGKSVMGKMELNYLSSEVEKSEVKGALGKDSYQTKLSGLGIRWDISKTKEGEWNAMNTWEKGGGANVNQGLFMNCVKQ